jgi:nitroreductase
MMEKPQSFHDLVRQRQSCRQFLAKPLGAAQIDAVLQDAQRAPSNCNTQPWHVHIVSGATRASLTQVLIAHAENARFSPDFTWDETAFPAPLDARRRAQGKSYYEALGIARDDKPGRHEGMLRNRISSARPMPPSCSCRQSAIACALPPMWACTRKPSCCR